MENRPNITIIPPHSYTPCNQTSRTINDPNERYERLSSTDDLNIPIKFYNPFTANISKQVKQNRKLTQQKTPKTDQNQRKQYKETRRQYEKNPKTQAIRRYQASHIKIKNSKITTPKTLKTTNKKEKHKTHLQWFITFFTKYFSL